MDTSKTARDGPPEKFLSEGHLELNRLYLISYILKTAHPEGTSDEPQSLDVFHVWYISSFVIEVLQWVPLRYFIF